MKKDLNALLDGVTPEELERFAGALDAPSPEPEVMLSLKRRVYEKTKPRGARRPAGGARSRRGVFLRVGAIAAVVGILCGVGALSGLFDGGITTNDFPSDGVQPIEHLLSRDDLAEIVVAERVNDGTDADAPGVDGSIADGDSVGYAEWNGLRLHERLYAAVHGGERDRLLAITVFDPTPRYSSLWQYEYRGKTYGEWRDAYAAAETAFCDLQITKGISIRYDEMLAEGDTKELEYLWVKLYQNVDKEFLHENGYVVSGEKPFDVDAISRDLNHYNALTNELANEVSACERQYRADNTPKLDWSALAARGFDVYVNERGVHIAVLTVEAFEAFAECVAEITPAAVLDDAVFRLATLEELGLDSNDLPTDDEMMVTEALVPDDDAA